MRGVYLIVGLEVAGLPEPCFWLSLRPEGHKSFH